MSCVPTTAFLSYLKLSQVITVYIDSSRYVQFCVAGIKIYMPFYGMYMKTCLHEVCFLNIVWVKC